MGPGDDATGRRRDAVEGDVYAMDALRGESQPPSPGRAPRSAPALTTRQQRTQHTHAEHAQQAAAELLRPAAALAAGVCAGCEPSGHSGGRLHDMGPTPYSSPPRSRQPCSSPPRSRQPHAVAVDKVLGSCQGGVPRGVGAAPRQPGLLHLFSGPSRPDSLAAPFAARGWRVRELDVLRGGARHDLAHDSVFAALLERATAGEWRLLVAGPPCSTFSVARFRSESGDARPLRRRSCGGRIDDMTFNERCRADEADLLVRRTLQLARAVVAAGGDVVIENPIDRGDEQLSDEVRTRSPNGVGVYDEPDHFPLWLVPLVEAYRTDTGSSALHFPLCAFGSEFQKWTTILCTPTAAELMRADLSRRRCDHGRHESVAVGYGPNGARAPAAAKYPAELHGFWAAALAGSSGDGGLLADQPAGYLAGGIPAGGDDAAGGGAVLPQRQHDFDAWLRDWIEAPALRRAMADSTAVVGQYSLATMLPERRDVVAGLVLESAEAEAVETQARGDWRGRQGPVEGASPLVRSQPTTRHPLAPVDVGCSGRQPRAGYQQLWVGRADRRRRKRDHAGDDGSVLAGLEGVLGNPFTLTNDRRPAEARRSQSTRDAAVDAYAQLLRAPPEPGQAQRIANGLSVVAALDTADAARARERAIGELARRVGDGEAFQLTCSCTPQRCHADEVAALVLERAGWQPQQSNSDLTDADPSWRPHGGAAGLFWDPADFEAIRGWRQGAMAAARAMRSGVEFERPADLHIPATRMRPEARALAPWLTGGDYADQPEPVAAAATEPPACGLRAGVFQRMARGGDEEIAAELPWGLEDDATGLDTYLAFHHPSCYAEQRYAQAATDVIDAEGPQGTGWLADRGEVPTVPLRAVPRGVVDQVHKLRVVTDHTHPFGFGISANDGVSVEHLPDIKLSSGVRYARMVATMQTAGAGVLMWKRDAVSAYRQVPIHPRDLWKCGVLTGGGFLVDTRLSFGARMAPNKFQRLMLVLMGEARRRMARFDRDHPPTDVNVRAWLEARRLRLGDEQAMLSAAVQYIDDTLGVSVNDVIAATGRGRGEHHAEIFDGVMAEAGVEMATGDKYVNSPDDVEALGIGVSAKHGYVYYPDKKRVRLEARIGALLERAAQGKMLARADIESLVGKENWVAHIAPVLQPLLRSAFAMAHARGRPQYVAASPQFVLDQRRILEALPDLPPRPLVPRAEFPQLDAADSTVLFQDASGSWGIGGFFVDGDEACYFAEPYPSDLKEALATRQLSIGPAELAAEVAAVLLALERRGRTAPFFTDFTDNESARAAATKGTSGTATMAPLAHALASATAAAGVALRTLRVTTKENAVADALSRDGSTDALERAAAAARLTPVRLEVPRAVWDLMRSGAEMPRLLDDDEGGEGGA